MIREGIVVQAGNNVKVIRISNIPTPTYKWGLFSTETECTTWVSSLKTVKALAAERGWRTYIFARRVG